MPVNANAIPQTILTVDSSSDESDSSDEEESSSELGSTGAGVGTVGWESVFTTT